MHKDQINISKPLKSEQNLYTMGRYTTRLSYLLVENYPHEKEQHNWRFQLQVFSFTFTFLFYYLLCLLISTSLTFPLFTLLDLSPASLPCYCLVPLTQYLPSIPSSLLPSPPLFFQSFSELHVEARGRQQGFPFTLLFATVFLSWQLLLVARIQSSSHLWTWQSSWHRGVDPPSLTQWVLNSCHMAVYCNKITYFRAPFVVCGDMCCVYDSVKTFNDYFNVLPGMWPLWLYHLDFIELSCSTKRIFKKKYHQFDLFCDYITNMWACVGLQCLSVITTSN